MRLTIPIEYVLKIADRDRWRCHVCGLGYVPADPWEIDHDRALARGGQNLASNLRLAHRSCNRGKSYA